MLSVGQQSSGEEWWSGHINDARDLSFPVDAPSSVLGPLSLSRWLSPDYVEVHCQPRAFYIPVLLQVKSMPSPFKMTFSFLWGNDHSILSKSTSIPSQWSLYLNTWLHLKLTVLSPHLNEEIESRFGLKHEEKHRTWRQTQRAMLKNLERGLLKALPGLHCCPECLYLYSHGKITGIPIS